MVRKAKFKLTRQQKQEVKKRTSQQKCNFKKSYSLSLSHTHVKHIQEVRQEDYIDCQ
jgi:hypothetical protein